MPEPQSFIQRLFKRFLSPASYEQMQDESQHWMLQCSNCKYERSVWDLRGIRWKASGSPRVYRRCPNCGETNWHKMYYKTSA